MRQAYQQGRGVLFFTGHFGYWEMQAIAHAAARASRCRCWRGRSTIRICTTMLERIRTRTGNTRDLPAGRDPQGAARAGRESRRRAADRSASAHAGRGVRGFLRPAGGDDVGARRAGAAHRRAGDSGVRAAAAAAAATGSSTSSRCRRRARTRPTPIREFTQRCTDVLEMYVRRHPELWLWMHRRWRDRDPALADEADGTTAS